MSPNSRWSIAFSDSILSIASEGSRSVNRLDRLVRLDRIAGGLPRLRAVQRSKGSRTVKDPSEGVIAAVAAVIVLIAVTVAAALTGVSLKFWEPPQSAWTPPASPAAAPLPSTTFREQPAKFLAEVHQRIDSDGDEIRGLNDQQLLAIGRAACRQPGIVQTRTQLRSLQRPKFLAAAQVYLCGRSIPSARPVPGARSGDPSSSRPGDVRARERVRRPEVDSRRTAVGLFCRDLKARGDSYSGAVNYWRTHGQPKHMDADGNGRPCETVYPVSDVSSYWRHSPAVPVPERSSRPPTRSGASPTPGGAKPDQGTASASPPDVASGTPSADAPAAPAPSATGSETAPPSVDPPAPIR
jgi:hypothetical protein